jgi:hypothetical protein
MPDPLDAGHFTTMDAGLEAFMHEVAYTIDHLVATVDEATPSDVGLEELDQRYGVDKDATMATYRSVLTGDPDTGAAPAVAIEQRIPWGSTAWVHMLEKVTVSDEWYEQNKDEIQ